MRQEIGAFYDYRSPRKPDGNTIQMGGKIINKAMTTSDLRKEKKCHTVFKRMIVANNPIGKISEPGIFLMS